jgi:cell division protein ZapE
MPNNQITLNQKQQEIFDQINQIFFVKKRNLLKFLGNNPKFHGVYIYGSIGSGKTFIMKKLYKLIENNKAFFHYHQFLSHIHNFFKSLDKKSQKNKIHQLASHLAKDFQYIFIDELEILDITDAMIIKELIPELIDLKVKILFSTNIHPQNLYKDGIQRESFIPFINYLEKNFLIYNLSNNSDYRLQDNHIMQNRYFIPNNQINNQNLVKILHKFLNNDFTKNSLIEINKHKFLAKYLSNEVVIFDFKDLFECNSSVLDFESITNKYKIIVIQNIRIITEIENDIIKRFINFIDLAYYNKNVLFCTLAITIEDIYIKGRYIKEFARTISRMNEMRHFVYEKN